jgi:two-component system chemotaxis response regulator CheB
MSEWNQSPWRDSAPAHDVVVLGASAGGVEALTALVAELPADFPGAIFVVLHLPAKGVTFLDRILARAGALPARIATDNEHIEAGHIYVAPPDHHLLLTPERLRLRLTRGPREHRSRPAIDPLFRSAAMAFGPRVIGAVLSGLMNDGIAGLLAIKERGGIALAQDPATALFAQMPQSACAHVSLDGVYSAPDLARVVTKLARQPAVAAEEAFPVSDDLVFEANMAERDLRVTDRIDQPGVLTSFSCPECQGPVWETRSGNLVRFGCRFGHAFTTETVLGERAKITQNTLWSAIISLEECAKLYDCLAATAGTHQRNEKTAAFSRRACVLRERITTIRQMLIPDNLLEA